MYFQFRFYFSLFAVVQFGILSADAEKDRCGSYGRTDGVGHKQQSSLRKVVEIYSGFLQVV